MAHEYVVEILPDEDGNPDPALRERFTLCANRRLRKLEELEGTYPAVGVPFDILDAFSGPFVWEMTDAEFEATPPSRIDLEVVAVDPAEPAGSGTVRVQVRVPV